MLHRNQIYPNIKELLAFLTNQTSEIDTINISFTPVTYIIAGTEQSEERKRLYIQAYKKGKTASSLILDEKEYSASTLKDIATSLAIALIQRTLDEFDWVEEYELNMTKFSFIGLFTFEELMRQYTTLDFESFVQTNNTVIIKEATPAEYLTGNHIAIIRNRDRMLQISTLGKYLNIQVNL